jgi:hypothetical protein
VTIAPNDAARRLAWVGAIRDPQAVLAWSLSDWERVVRLARRVRLLARLAEAIDAAGLMAEVPIEPRRHLVAEQRLSIFRIAAMTWALQRIQAAIGTPEITLVLLKGAAYLGQSLPIAAGRMPSDVDILVPAVHIGEAQARLQAAHWQFAGVDEYDRRYYEEWSHEVPPMVHPVHPIELDLHHNILPPTASTSIDASVLLSRLRPSQWSGWQVLDPLDQVLHSAAHLFFDSELRDRVRDLLDLDGLLRHFGTRADFWQALPVRARELGLAEPLALALHFCAEWLGTPLPAGVRSAQLEAGVSHARMQWLVRLFGAILMPREPDEGASWSQSAASWLALARYQHWRLPMRLLLPHIARKASKRLAS